MSGGALHGDAETESGFYVRSARAAAEIGGARREDSGFGGMRAARAELGDGAASGGGEYARGFRRDHRLKADRRDQIGLDDLGFDNRRADGEDRLATEHWRAFRYGEDIAGEAELFQQLPEPGGRELELRERAKVGDLLGAEAEIQQVVHRLRESGGEEIVAVGGQAADEEFERRDLTGLSGGGESCRHGQFVKIGEERVHGSYFFFSSFLAEGGGGSLTSPAAFFRSSNVCFSI